MRTYTVAVVHTVQGLWQILPGPTLACSRSLSSSPPLLALLSPTSVRCKCALQSPARHALTCSRSLSSSRMPDIILSPTPHVPAEAQQLIACHMLTCSRSPSGKRMRTVAKVCALRGLLPTTSLSRMARVMRVVSCSRRRLAATYAALSSAGLRS